MPAGNSHRLQAVLRAGQHKPASTGESINIAGADALKANPPRKGPGANKVAKQDNDNMGASNDSSAWLEDLVNSYKEESKGRSETLEAVRKDAQDCVEKRNTAVNEALKEQEAAATKIVEALKDKLNQVSAELDRLQAAQADSNTQKGECEAARASLDRELKALQESSNTERDAAKAAAELAVQETVAEWTTKLKECQAKNATSGAEASKKLEESLDQLKASQEALTAQQEALKAEQEVNAKHMEEAVTNTKKFEKAVEEACAVLKAALA
jgi:chromosome segregation ATPase